MKETKIYKVSSEGEFSSHLWKYSLLFPDHLANWDVWDYWERARFESMRNHLTASDVMYDVGTEQGSLSALISKYITSHLVLIEPSWEFWFTIQSIFKANHLEEPTAFFDGFASDKTENLKKDFDFNKWPNRGELLTTGMPYHYLHKPEDKSRDQSITLDDLTFKLNKHYEGVDALNIDVEGAELLVLKGASKILKQNNLLVWVSIHPDLALRDYNSTSEDLFAYMAKLGYTSRELLGIDHEEHWLFKKI